MGFEISLLCLQQPTTDMEHVTEAYTAHPSHSIYLRSILITILHLQLGLPSGHFPSGVPNNILYGFLSFLTQATCPTHLILLDFITIITSWEQHKWWSYSLHSFLHPHLTSASYIPVLLGTMLTHPLSLPLMWDQVSHPNGKQHAKWQTSTSFHFQRLPKKLSPGVKWQGLEAPSTVKVNNEWSLLAASPYAFMVLTKNLLSLYHYRFQMRYRMTTHAKSLVQSIRWIEYVLNFFIYVTLMCWASFPYIQNFLHFQRM